MILVLCLFIIRMKKKKSLEFYVIVLLRNKKKHSMSVGILLREINKKLYWRDKMAPLLCEN